MQESRFHSYSSHRLKYYGHFEPLYLDNQSRYRNETKRRFNGMVLSISWPSFDERIYSSFFVFFKRIVEVLLVSNIFLIRINVVFSLR